MALLHDAADRAEITRRVSSLRGDSRGRWGKMTVDQMLWHVNKALALHLGEVTIGPGNLKLPKSLMKFVVLKLPFVKNAPTHPDFVARASYDFAGERDRTLALIDRLSSRPLDGDWPVHPAFGAMTGREVSRLMAKHLDHHLRQFGV
jgi:hypothetical protein